MGTRNDDISLILAKAKKQGFLPDVKDEEVDILEAEAKAMLLNDVAYSGLSRGTILATGSSITVGVGATSTATKGYVPRLKYWLETMLPGQTVTMVNKGVGGEGTEHMLPRYAPEVITSKPQFAIIETSPNDFRTDRIQTPEGSLENIQKMVAIARLNGALPVLLTNTPMIPGEVVSGVMDSSSVEQQLATNILIRNFATAENIILADPYPVLEGILTDFLDDGLHPNDYGYDVIAQVIARAIIGMPPLYIPIFSVVSTDNFDRANSATTLGAPWETYSPVLYGIDANQAYRVSGAGAFMPAVQDATIANQAVQVDATLLTTGTVGVVVRVIDGINNIEAYLTTGSCVLAKVINGVRTTLQSANSTYTVGTPYTIRAEAVGDNIKVYINGIQTIDYTLTTDAATFANATKAGIWAQYNGTTLGKFNNFTLYKEA